jgi:GNAT superfamily N-acetyltransferase
MTVRLARADEVHRLSDIERDAGDLFRAVPGFEWIADHGVRAFEDWLPLIARDSCWVAVDDRDDQPIGFLAGRLHGRDLFIEEVSVVGSWQRRGIGSALMSAAEGRVRASGLRAVTLTTFVDIPWNAPAYERRGYAVIPDDDLPSYLADIRAQEDESGLQIEPRCAMERIVR